MNIRWSEPAVIDLENIKGFIAKDSEYYAAEFTARIINAVEKTSSFPSMGRKVPEIDNESIREIIFYNYRIIYQIENSDRILVLAIIHAERDMNNSNLHLWEVT